MERFFRRKKTFKKLDKVQFLGFFRFLFVAQFNTGRILVHILIIHRVFSVLTFVMHATKTDVT